MKAPAERVTRDIVDALRDETGLSAEETELYLSILRSGSIARRNSDRSVDALLARGMVIVSGDGKRFLPVHPRLAVANSYRTWRERMVREMNERRMRVDKLILQLIPIYEAATEKKGEGRQVESR